MPHCIQERLLEWVAIFSLLQGMLPDPRDRTCVSSSCRQILYHQATSEAHTLKSVNTLAIFSFLDSVYNRALEVWRVSRKRKIDLGLENALRPRQNRTISFLLKEEIQQGMQA